MKIILPDGSVQEAEDELRAIRHTASHVLAQAVKRLYPETKLTQEDVEELERILHKGGK